MSLLGVTDNFIGIGDFGKDYGVASLVRMLSEGQFAVGFLDGGVIGLWIHSQQCIRIITKVHDFLKSTRMPILLQINLDLFQFLLQMPNDSLGLDVVVAFVSSMRFSVSAVLAYLGVWCPDLGVPCKHSFSLLY